MAVEMDLITLEIVQEYLVSTVREMRVTMIRTAHSSIIYEGHDFSCALLGANGDLVAQSEDSPAHILPLPWQVREAIEFFGGDFSEGDVVIVNDPYASGTHMNDVAIIVPHFHEGELLAFVVTRAHWGDVGGMTPGSISGEASEIFQEGLRLPFLKIHEGGRPVEPLLRLIFANVRNPEEREGDFHAMLSCCITASRRLDELLERFGLDEFKTAVDALIDRAERRMCLAIETLPDGTYRYEDYLDADPSTGDPVLLTVAIKVEGDRGHAGLRGLVPPSVRSHERQPRGHGDGQLRRPKGLARPQRRDQPGSVPSGYRRGAQRHDRQRRATRCRGGLHGNPTPCGIGCHGRAGEGGS